MKDYLVSAENLIDVIGECTCSFTTAKKAMELLKDSGFKQLKINENWDIESGGKYYVNVYDSSVYAFTIGKNFEAKGKIKIAAAHTDHPCLYVKPNPEVRLGDYGCVNVEIYGGLILNTWLDRPLSAAGKITYKSNDIYNPNVKIIDFEKSLFTIPNLAIHQNREINKGIGLSRQKDMLPMCTMLKEKLNKDDFFLNYMAGKAGIEKEDILDFEIYIYNNDIPDIIGIEDDFISAPRLDNITSVAACVNGIINGKNSNSINLIALFDNEEIGSSTKQGADSILLSNIVEKIYMYLGFGRIEYLNSIMSGMFLSVDVAHGEHPNKLEKSDLTNKNPLNNGLVIKRACSQTYATDSTSIAIIEQLAKKNNIPYQKFVSNSDITTGSTLGNYVDKFMPMRAVDLGVPVLAMHSAREVMGSKDQRALEKLLEVFFSEE